MNTSIANPRGLGFGIFAVSSWLLSMVAIGIIPITYGNPMPGLATFSAIGLLVAGIACFLRREAWLGFFFILWSAVGWSFDSLSVSAWIWFALALLNLYLWLGAKKNGQTTAVAAIALLIGLDAFGQGLARIIGVYWPAFVGGCLGLAAALVAFCVSAAFVLHPEEGE